MIALRKLATNHFIELLKGLLLLIMKRYKQVTIIGKLPRRDVILFDGEGKSKCVTCESNLAGIGQFKANEFLVEYEEIDLR